MAVIQPSPNHIWCFCIAFLLLAVVNCQSKQCGGKFVEQEVKGLPGEISTTRKEFISSYDCPINSEAPDQVLCCEPPEAYCCREKRFWEIDFGWAILIVTCVVVVSATIAITLIICFCWEKCPLYLFCRSEAKLDYIGKPDEATCLTMPTENVKNVRVYNPIRANQEFV